MWNILFKKKENKMTTTESSTVRKLKETVTSQKTQINNLVNRISQLTDDVHIIKNDLSRFKTDVASDVKYLTDRVDGTE
jgi:predicted RNase H-like nuclease (RuvC/YqgF family)